MKIAIPIAQGRLHDHFGGSREFALIQVDPEKKAVLSSETLPAPQHVPGAFPRWLREQGVSVVIVGGIGRRALDLLAKSGITVRIGAPEALPDRLVAAYLNGQLTQVPNACEHHGHDHDHGHGHGHGHDHGHDQHPD